jgi:hypothetical protein
MASTLREVPHLGLWKMVMGKSVMATGEPAAERV